MEARTGIEPMYMDFQWRFAKFPEHFQLVAKIKSRCATECASESGVFGDAASLIE